MTSRIRNSPLIPALLAAGSALLLSSCGGGGGGDSGALPPPTQLASTITATNQNDVAAQAYSSANAINKEVAGSASIVTGVSVGTGTSGLTNAALTNLYRALQVKPVNMVAGVSGSTTEACSGGGTISVSYNVTNPDTISNNDALVITSNNCVEGAMMITGGLSITFSNVSGVPSATSAWSATMKMTFADFAVTENNVIDKATGDLSLGYSQASAGNETFSASGNSLQMSTTKGGTTVARTLSAYDYSGSVSGFNLYTYRSNFTFSGNLPRLGNVSYTVRTLTDFKQQGSANPYQGVMTVTATDKTSLTFTVLNTTSMQLGVDRNGDGTVDDTSNKTWDELLSLI